MPLGKLVRSLIVTLTSLCWNQQLPLPASDRPVLLHDNLLIVWACLLATSASIFYGKSGPGSDTHFCLNKATLV